MNVSGSTWAEAPLRCSWASFFFSAGPSLRVCSAWQVDTEHQYWSKHFIPPPYKTSPSQSTFPLRCMKLLRDDEGDRGSTPHRNREISTRKLEISCIISNLLSILHSSVHPVQLPRPTNKAASSPSMVADPATLVSSYAVARCSDKAKKSSAWAGCHKPMSLSTA